MHSAVELLYKSSCGKALTSDECSFLMGTQLSSAQLGALAAALSTKQCSLHERNLLNSIREDNVLINALMCNVTGGAMPEDDAPNLSRYVNFFRSTYYRQPVTKSQADVFMRDVASGVIQDAAIGFWLMIAKIKGLPLETTRLLTDAMIASGDVFDYRKEPSLKGYRLVRRYPTGALSEKTALILPCLISAFRHRYPVISAFLVAKSLGFTGGTWDKLSSIPEFTFPLPGNQAIRAIEDCGVAMSVTDGTLNPADRILYRMRSATATIECEGLIVSSIASKQLALPAHRLLMDVRYGVGAFLKTEREALSLATILCRIINDNGVPCFFQLCDSLQPTGSSVGNSVEVAEAIAVLGGNPGAWDQRGIIEQRHLVVDFFSKLMSAEFPRISQSEWSIQANKSLDNGEALTAFRSILYAHGVSKSTVKALVSSPFETLGINDTHVDIISGMDGRLHSIDQVRLGHIVNFQLGSGATRYGGVQQPPCGIILHVRIGDKVSLGDVLCSIVGIADVDSAIIASLRDSFIINT